MYVRPARAEEREALAEFGAASERYMAEVPAALSMAVDAAPTIPKACPHYRSSHFSLNASSCGSLRGPV
jgi:hypothetical protein